METKEFFDSDLKMLHRLENILDDPVLSAYFRRYMRLSFCEENYMFFVAVQEFKEKNYIKEACTKISPDMDLKQIAYQSAKALYEKFIMVNGAYQINVTMEVRVKLDELFCEGADSSGEIDFDKVFESAQREVFHEMRNGEFMSFKKHVLYNHFIKTHKQKFAQRYFVVGNSMKKVHLADHHIRKLSGLNFDGAKEADKNFSFDCITQQNINEFQQAMQDSGLGDEMRDALLEQSNGYREGGEFKIDFGEADLEEDDEDTTLLCVENSAREDEMEQ